jgi:predicted anti-sigma-YlaC factor YlaD
VTGGHDELRTSLGGYVTGGLEPAERAAVEQHLEGCADCRAEVSELAGLPGLLRRPPEAEPIAAVPTDLSARVLAGVAARRRAARRQLRVWQAVAAVAVVVALGVGGVTMRSGGGSPDFAAMRPIVAGPTAEAAAEARPWGTALEVSATGLRQGATYTLVAVARDGRTEQAGAWGYSTGRRTRCSGSTSIARSDLAAVEIRTVDGRPLLRLDT